MADNTQLNVGVGGNVIADEDIGGVHFSKVKIVLGAAGVDGGDVDAANPLPITGAVLAQVGGFAADGAAPVGNPVWIAGWDGASVRALDVDVTGRAATRILSWFGSAAPTVGQKPMASSLPVTLPSDQATNSNPLIVSPTVYASTAFGQVRVAAPYTLFDGITKYNIDPLEFGTSLSGGGTVTHVPLESAARLAVTAANGDRARLRTHTFHRYQAGKALSDDERVLTTNGWKRMGDMRVGDEVFDANGMPTRVRYVAPQGERQLYRLTFDDGTTVDADEEHLWVTLIRRGQREGQREILTTKAMLERCGSNPRGFRRWRIPASPWLVLPERDVPLNPYTVGALLGDGSLAHGSTPHITCADAEMLQWLDGNIQRSATAKFRYALCGITDAARAAGIMGHKSESKFVPPDYLWNSVPVRFAVLQGLMDTDGTVAKNGTAEFNTSSRRLADDVEFLVRSLGGQVKRRIRRAGYRDSDGVFKRCLDSHRLRVILPMCPFRLSRKANRWSPRTRISFDRYVHSIKKLAVGPATCISVESPDATFLTAGHVVTHNSIHIKQTCYHADTGRANQNRFWGWYDDNDGLFWELTGTTMNVGRRSSVSGAPVDVLVAQAAWNYDPMNGLGPSGVTLDVTKGNIYEIEAQWLGVGVVHFFINGFLVHTFQIPNTIAGPYMRTAVLPLQWEIVNTAASTGSSFTEICSSVVVEGGDAPPEYGFTAFNAAAINLNAERPILSIRPTTVFPALSAIVNRMLLLPKLLIVSCEAGRCGFRVVLNGTLGGPTAWNPISADSGAEFDVASTTLVGGETVGRSFLANTNDVGQLPLTQFFSLLARKLRRNAFNTGVDVLTITGVSEAAGAVDMRASLTWGEVR